MEVLNKHLLRLITKVSDNKHLRDSRESENIEDSQDKTKADSGGPDFIIVLAPGAFLRWYEARNDFNFLCKALYERVLIPGESSISTNKKYTYTIHWLGYGIPEAPYPIGNTVYKSVDTLTKGMDILLQRYPSSKVVCIGHSLGGLVLLSWAISRSQSKRERERNLVKRVQSIITLNSPLRGLNEFMEIYQENFGAKNALFMGRDFPPPIALDLQTTSSIIDSIVNFGEECPVKHLLNVTTHNDPIVPPGIATVSYATEVPIELMDVNVISKKEYLIHTDALKSQVFIDTVIKVIDQILDQYSSKADINK